jgi:FemAB-related protein (PEP-CTERM system-associated)
VKSRLFGKFLVSTPFAVYGGVCARTDEARTLLLEMAQQVAREQNVDYLELRNLRPDPSDLRLSDLYVTFSKPLPADPAECLQDLPRKARAAARQGIKNNLKSEVNLNKLKEHYELNAIQMRRLGSPVLPFSWFQCLAAEFKDQSTVLSVSYRGKLVASVFAFLFRDTVLPYYSGSLQEYNRYQTNNFMYLKLMEFGVENGYKIFDFGRSRKNTGPYSFKKNQGFTPQPLFYQYYLNRADDIPNVNPSNPKFDLPKRVWQKMPLPLTKWLGPKLARAIP